MPTIALRTSVPPRNRSRALLLVATRRRLLFIANRTTAAAMNRTRRGTEASRAEHVAGSIRCEPALAPAISVGCGFEVS